VKAKTHKALSKRIRFTATGKAMHKPASASHLRVNKSPRKTAALAVHSADVKRVKRMLPGN
jgi:large subunit ribosomal protein L35